MINNDYEEDTWDGGKGGYKHLPQGGGVEGGGGGRGKFRDVKSCSK